MDNNKTQSVAYDLWYQVMLGIDRPVLMQKCKNIPVDGKVRCEVRSEVVKIFVFFQFPKPILSPRRKHNSAITKIIKMLKFRLQAPRPQAPGSDFFLDKSVFA